MSYCLTNIEFGTSKASKLCSFTVEADIKDICFVKDYGTLFLHGDSIGHIDKDGVVDKSHTVGLNGAISISYSDIFKMAYIFEKDMNLKILDLTGGVSSFLGQVGRSALKKRLANVNEFRIDSTVNSQGDVFAVNSAMHQCLVFRNSDYDVYAGRGRSNYSVSNTLKDCSLSAPSGIDFQSGSLYISDTGNHCIREISKAGIHVIAGSPLGDSDIDSPSKICVKNHASYFIDGYKILCLTLNDRKYHKVYESENIVSIDIDDSKGLIILENEDAN